MLLNGVNHVAILTNDTKRLHAFYRDVFDVEVAVREVVPHVGSKRHSHGQDLVDVATGSLIAPRYRSEDGDSQRTGWGVTYERRSFFLGPGRADATKATKVGTHHRIPLAEFERYSHELMRRMAEASAADIGRALR